MDTRQGIVYQIMQPVNGSIVIVWQAFSNRAACQLLFFLGHGHLARVEVALICLNAVTAFVHQHRDLRPFRQSSG
jgi:hypothetical protein